MRKHAPITLTLLATALLGPTAGAQLAWSEVLPDHAPEARFGHTMIQNHPSFQPFLFGGTDGVVAFGDTWVFDGADWKRKATTGPAARHDHAMVMLHYTDDSMLLFGGEDATGALLGDTWAWNGSSWSQVATAIAPSPRAGHAFARDEYEEKDFLLFGGRTASGVSDETWRFVDGQWHPVATGRRPAAREGHSMIMVNDTQTFIMFGGHAGGTVFDDVWEFDGVDWRRIGTLPAPRTNQSPVYESLWRFRIMTFGGRDGAVLADTIERTSNGFWVSHTTIGSPAARDEAALALGWKPSHPQTVLFGGRDKNGAALGDTWTVEPVTMPSSELFGQGCGPGAWSLNGGADLFVSHSVLMGSTVSMTAYTPAPGRAIFVIGDELANPPLGCGLLVTPSQLLPVFVESLFAGLAFGTLELEIPFEPTLLGAQISLQAIVEMGKAAERISISAGTRVTIAE